MSIAPIALDRADRKAAAKLVFDGVSKRFGRGPDSVLAVQRADFAKWAKPVKASGFQAD